MEHLKQTSSVQNYIADFTNLSYQITDISEEEAFHKFRSGLKQGIRLEIDKREITSNLKFLQTQALRYNELTFSLKETSRTDFKKPFTKKWEEKPR